jgi:crotonobetainyl-CoA:carnitine CoA-transferase CaiB-like acyl-CoA transferase
MTDGASATTQTPLAGQKPLAGVRVLDFTAFPPGGVCTVMLADLGAEVIRVDSPAQKGSRSLVIGQVALSRGKRSMTLDMRNPASSEVLKRLAPTIDVVVENAKPGAMESRGFGYSQARAANPRLIWCAITGFGQTGPYADYAGHDLSYLAHSGVLGALSAERPFHPGAQIATPLGGMTAVIGIQSALLQRARSGEGGFLDISLSESAGWLLTAGINALSDKPYVLTATPDRRLYACSDGRWVAVASAEPRTWSALCDGLGVPDLKTTLHQPAHAQAVTETLAGIFQTRPAAEWVERLSPLGAAVTVMNHADEVPADPQVRARAAVVESAGVPVPATPIRLSGADGRPTTATATEPPHMVGDDTDDILQSAGFTEAERQALGEAGVI